MAEAYTSPSYMKIQFIAETVSCVSQENERTIAMAKPDPDSHHRVNCLFFTFNLNDFIMHVRFWT